jgi:hypothetical protein
LYSPSDDKAVILVSEELDAMLPQIREQNRVHLLLYAAPVTKSMLPFSRLAFYSMPSLPKGVVIPDWLILELSIFAGGLYLDYTYCCSLIKLLDVSEHQGTENMNPNKANVPLSKDPVHFLTEWLANRRSGQEVTHTPLGYVCQGRPLRPEHPFFSESGPARPSISSAAVVAHGQVVENDEDEDDEDMEDYEDYDIEGEVDLDVE